MGVYIKGMEMPTNCSECSFCGYYGNGEHMCDIIQKAVEYESAKMSRLDDCPLVPVPPHGDLIDRVELDFVMLEPEFADEYYGKFITTVEEVDTAQVIIPADHIGDANEMVTDKEGEG